MNKKGELIIQTPKKFEMDSHWFFYYFNILPDKIVLKYYHMSYPPVGTPPIYLPEPWLYKKVKVAFKNRQYIW